MSQSVTSLTVEQWSGQDDTHLIDCSTAPHRLMKEVSFAFDAMQKHAAAEGIDLQLVSTFRNFERQLSIWNSKWQGALPLYDINDRLLDTSKLNDKEKMHAILTWSALPGASRHHWGTDLDVYDKAAVTASGQTFNLIRSEYIQGGPCYKLAEWLEAHVQQYKFSLPYREYKNGVAPEPWHLSFQPIAESIVRQLTVEQLAHVIAEAPLAGKQIVMENLDEIFHRYTLNEGLK